MAGYKGYNSYDGSVSGQVHPAFRAPLSRQNSGQIGQGLYQHDNESETELLREAQGPAQTEYPPAALDRWRTGGYGPIGQDEPGFTSYEHYRAYR